LYTEGPTAAEAAAFGLTLEEAQGEPTQVWPDNLQAVNVFIAASTQWRTSHSGPVGLDYTALEAVMRMLCIARKDRGPTLDDVRVLEDSALDVMRKSKR